MKTRYVYPLCISMMLLAQSLFAASTVGFSARVSSVGEAAGRVELSVLLSDALEAAVSVDYFSIDGTALAGQDYSAVSGTLTFAAGVTNLSIAVPILNDDLFEISERFQVALTNGTGDTVLSSMRMATVAIWDNETPVEFMTTEWSISEGLGAIEVAVVRGDDGVFPVSIDFTTVDDTALAGLDYELTSGTLTFETGNALKQVIIPILNDGLIEGTETFAFELSNLQGGAKLGTKTNATISIVDNDTPVSVEFGAYWAREDEGSVMIGIARRGEGESVTLDYATVNATAVADADYTPANGTLTFEAGENLKLLTIPILNDGLKEAEETFQIYLTNAPAGMVGPITTASITIRDNDPGVQFEFKREWVRETDGVVEVKVIRGNDGELDPFTIDYATTDGTAQAGVHYVETTGTLSFGAGELSRSFAVPILNDLAATSDLTFQIQLNNLSGSSIPGPTQAITVTILDMAGMQAHAFSRMQLLPDRCLELTLEGAVHSRYRSFFDLYSIETSTDLARWEPWMTLECMGGAGDALRCVDSTSPGVGSRFYRLSAEPAITPIPPPTGPHPVGMITRFITDSTRRNRFGVSTNGTFSVTLFYPAVAQAGARFPRFLDEGSGMIKQDPNYRESWWMEFIPVESQLIARALSEAPIARAAGPCPVVLFSAGWTGWTWRQTSTKAQELASHGYVVVWVTHYDATWACLPNQRVTYQTDDKVPMTAPGLQERLRDLRFVLEQLQQWNQPDGEFAGCLDLETVAAIGFSWGTYSAAEFCRLEPRCRAVIQLDCDAGAETAPELARLGLQKPILILNRADNVKTDLYDKATKDAVWAQISGSAHGHFSDGYWINFPSDLDRSREIVLTLRAYVLWFLNKHLKGSTDPMPALADYPRVINLKQK